MIEDSRFRKFNPYAFYGKELKHEFEKLSENIIGAAIIVVVKITFRLRNVILLQHLCRHPFFGTLI